MHITRSRSLTIRMGDYESITVKAEVGVTHRDFGFSDEQLSQLDAHLTLEIFERMQMIVADQLDTALADDIADAAELTGDRKSFIHKIASPAPPAPATPAPRRRPRKDTP